VALFLSVIDEAYVSFMIRKCHGGFSFAAISGGDKERRHSKFVMKNVLSQVGAITRIWIAVSIASPLGTPGDYFHRRPIATS
jgi:hypothetical protein